MRVVEKHRDMPAFNVELDATDLADDQPWRRQGQTCGSSPRAIVNPTCRRPVAHILRGCSGETNSRFAAGGIAQVRDSRDPTACDITTDRQAIPEKLDQRRAR